MRYTEIYVNPISQNPTPVIKDVCESINKKSFEVGVESAFNENELSNSLDWFKEQIASYDTSISQQLKIETIEL